MLLKTKDMGSGWGPRLQCKRHMVLTHNAEFPLGLGIWVIYFFLCPFQKFQTCLQ